MRAAYFIVTTLGLIFAVSFILTQECSAEQKKMETAINKLDQSVNKPVQTEKENYLSKGRKSDLILEVSKLPASGLIFTKMPAFFSSGSDPEIVSDKTSFKGQYIQTGNQTGWLAAIIPGELIKKSQNEILKLEIRPGKSKIKGSVVKEKIEIKRPSFHLTQQKDKLGGFPSKIRFNSGYVLQTMNWEDRLFDNNNETDNRAYAGIWLAVSDKDPSLEILSEGPVCTVVRQKVRFIRAGKETPSKAAAVYDWFYFKTNDGLICLQTKFEQKTVHDWKECHFLEFHINDGSFPNWTGANRQSKEKKTVLGAFKDLKNRPAFDCWGAFVRDKDFIAVVDKNCYFYNDVKGRRIYIHADSQFAWGGWRSVETENSSWLQIGTAENSAGETIAKISEERSAASLRWNFSDPDWRHSLENVDRFMNGSNRSSSKEIRSLLIKESSDLAVELSLKKNSFGRSLSLEAVADKKTGFLLSETSRDLFRVSLENQKEKKSLTLSSLSYWKEIEFKRTEWTFRSPAEYPELEGWSVFISMKSDPKKEGMVFDLKTAELPKNWRILSGTIGGLTLGNFGPEMTAIYPGGSGTIVRNAASSGVSFGAMYPSLSAVMAWTAVWDQSRKLGLYIASHDKDGGAKKIIMKNPAGSGQLIVEFEYPMPIDPKNESSASSISGQIIWKTFCGDWYDATRIYRDWVRNNASWFPKLGPEGRVSTPLWMKQLCVWGRVFGTADKVVPIGKKFRETLGIPVGLHWYQWHEIPFDNDYPHYFPAKKGFSEGVRELQQAGCYVVPYTNGHLWDTRDRENEDWQFSKIGKAGACKHSDGSIFKESYRSKEKDGSKVVLAAMCPGSKEWKNKIAENVKKIAVDNGLNGVYMDQIACVGPIMCEDTEHGHPLRGGTWWTGEYKKLLLAARATIPQDKIFSSESNAETYADVLEGMVCWHIENENTVPAYSTIYSGVVFQYGRSYDSNVRAMLMKWGQELVYGEQLGWFPPEFMDHPDKLNYFRPLIRFRYHLIDYFYKGEGIRPPKLLDPIPAYSENWNIFGRFSINTVPIVQTGARRLLKYKYTSEGDRIWSSGKVDSALLIFTNYSKETVKSRIALDWKDLGFCPDTVKIEKVDSEGRKIPLLLKDLTGPIEFPGGATWGIILHR